MDELTINHTSAVFDISQENVEYVDMPHSSPARAVILNNNPLSDLGFIRKFPFAELLQMDNTNMKCFDDLELQNMKRLQYLILRLNMLSNFAKLEPNTCLQILDVSMN